MKPAKIQQTPETAPSAEWLALGALARKLGVGVDTLERRAGDVLAEVPRVVVGAHTFFDGARALAVLAPVVAALRDERERWAGFATLGDEAGLSPTTLHKYADRFAELPRRRVGDKTLYPYAEGLAIARELADVAHNRARWASVTALAAELGVTHASLASRLDGALAAVPQRRRGSVVVYDRALARAAIARQVDLDQVHARRCERPTIQRESAEPASITAHRGHLTWARGTNARQAQGRGFWRLRLDANGRRLTIRFAGAEDKRASAELTAAHVTALALAGPLPSGGALVFVDGVLKPLILPPPKPAPRTRRIVEVSRPSGPILACAVRVWRELVGVRERAVRVEAIEENGGTLSLDETLLPRDFEAGVSVERVKCCADRWTPDVLAMLRRFTTETAT